jgi:dihydropyrimidinase
MQVVNEPVYIVHVSCAESATIIAHARREGQPIWGEALCQHLVIDDSVYQQPDWHAAAAHVMSPPFRAKGHQEALWQALSAGDLQTTARWGAFLSHDGG